MPHPTRSFLDIYTHNFARVAIVVPHMRLAAPLENAAEIARLYGQAASEGAALVLFPELSLSGYSLDDLHQQDALLKAVLDGLQRLPGGRRHALPMLGLPPRLFQRPLQLPHDLLLDVQRLGS